MIKSNKGIRKDIETCYWAKMFEIYIIFIYESLIIIHLNFYAYYMNLLAI